jgi:hypothetical protein
MTTSKTPYSRATFTIVIERKPKDSTDAYEVFRSSESDAGDFEDEFVELLQQQIECIFINQCSDFVDDGRPIFKKL